MTNPHGEQLLEGTNTKTVIVRGFQTENARNNEYLYQSANHGIATSCRQLRELSTQDRSLTGFQFLAYYNKETEDNLGDFSNAVIFLGGSYDRKTGQCFDEDGKEI